MERMEKELERVQIEVFGVLRVGDNKYWLVAPFPVKDMDDWVTEKDSVFYVVPFLNTQIEIKELDRVGVIYPKPRFIVVRGDYIIEWLDDIKIWIQKEGKEKRTLDRVREVFEDNYRGNRGYIFGG